MAKGKEAVAELRSRLNELVTVVGLRTAVQLLEEFIEEGATQDSDSEQEEVTEGESQKPL